MTHGLLDSIRGKLGVTDEDAAAPGGKGKDAAKAAAAVGLTKKRKRGSSETSSEVKEKMAKARYVGEKRLGKGACMQARHLAYKTHLVWGRYIQRRDITVIRNLECLEKASIQLPRSVPSLRLCPCRLGKHRKHVGKKIMAVGEAFSKHELFETYGGWVDVDLHA